MLLYNVGPGNFTHLVRHGLWFARTYALPPPPLPVGWAAEHYYRYEPGPSVSDATWTQGEVLAEFRALTLTAIRKPHEVWFAVRQQGTPPMALPMALPQAIPQFAIDIVLTPPRRYGETGGPSLAGIVKPLLDGVISAYHDTTGENSSSSLAGWPRTRPAPSAS